MISTNEYQNMRRYVEGRMTPPESVHFENEMSRDSFLADAVEGFKTDPGAFDDMPKLSRPSFSWMYILGTLGIVVLFVWLPSEPEATNSPLMIEQKVEVVGDSEPELNYEQEFVAQTEVEHRNENLEPETAKQFTDFEMPEPKAEEVKPFVFIEAFMRPIEASEITAFATKEIKNNTHIVYIQDLKIVHFSDLSSDLRSSDIEHGSHLPASFESSAPEASELEERLIKRVNEKSSYATDLELALIDFQKGDFAAALSRFKTLDKHYGRNVNHSFYTGLCKYYMGSFDEAATIFLSVENDIIQSFRQEASWYHALSLQAMGKKGDAQRCFAEIYHDNGHYAPMAASRLIGLK